MRSDDPKFDFMWRPKGVNVFGGAMVTDCTYENMDIYDDKMVWKFSVMYSSVQSLTPVEIAKMKCSGEWDDYIG
jgi:hypothetical protein